MNPALSDIVHRVKKLYDLSRSTTSQNEASVAIRAAEKLLQEHRLSLAEIENHDASNLEQPSEDGERLDPGLRIASWKKYLLSTLCRHYGCTSYVGWVSGIQGGFWALRIIGCPTDVELCKLQYGHIKQQIDQLTAANASGRGRSYCDSYRKGMISAFGKYLESTRIQVRKAATTTALVRLDQKAAEAKQKMQELYPDLRTGPGWTASTSSGWDHGQRDGKKLRFGCELGAGVARLTGRVS